MMLMQMLKFSLVVVTVLASSGSSTSPTASDTSTLGLTPPIPEGPRYTQRLNGFGHPANEGCYESDPVGTDTLNEMASNIVNTDGMVRKQHQNAWKFALKNPTMVFDNAETASFSRESLSLPTDTTQESQTNSTSACRRPWSLDRIKNKSKELRESFKARRKAAKKAASSRSSTRSGPSLSEQLNAATDRKYKNSMIGQMEAGAREMWSKTKKAFSAGKASYNRIDKVSDDKVNDQIGREWKQFCKSFKN